PTKSIVELFEIMSESVEYYLQIHYSSESINKYMYEYVLIELLENKIEEEAVIQERIRSVGLERVSQYQLLKIVFEDEENTSIDYMMEQVHVIFPESRPFVYEGNIVMLLSYERKYNTPEDVREDYELLIDNFLTTYGAFCGQSDPFQDITKIDDAYKQTSVAAAIGSHLYKKKKATGQPVGNRSFEYRDYFIYHMITACSKEVRLESLCYKQLLQLKEADIQKNTDYAGLLYTYLLNERKPTDTARHLHMHRNNVIYHADRISGYLGVNLDDPKVRLRLLIAFKVIDLL
ncbi:MAG: PucR family transcriptional regulator, partial [Saezia sp.]